MIVELALFVIGMGFYASKTRARDKAGHYGYLALVATLAAIYFAALYGPPPPSAAAVAAGGQLLWLFVIWAYWLDGHREVVESRPDAEFGPSPP